MDSNLIYKYLSGELDELQTKKLHEWVSASEINRKYFAEIRNLWTGAGLNQKTEKTDIDHELQLFKIRLDKEKFPQKRVLKLRYPNMYKRGTLKYLTRIAAILLIMYSTGFTGYYLIRNNKVGYNQLSTKRGEKATVILSDGTKIWLNSETTLKYPVDIAKHRVNVYLDGEAYFNVTKERGRKLIVNASNINITVLGTSFNVKSYANEGTVETTLEKGTILITPHGQNEPGGHGYILKPNQRATYIKKTSHFLISDLASEENYQPVTRNKTPNITANINEKTLKPITGNTEDIKLYTSWKDGRLIFKSERFEVLAQRMERWYDVQIEIKSQELKDSKYTGRFEKESVEQALNALSLSLPFRYKIDLNKITIYKE